jgi:D-lactate dehydrogenase
MKIVFFGLEKDKQAVFSGAFTNADVSFYEEKLDENNVALAKDADAISVFVNCTVDKKVIDSIPNLKFIATRSTGFDHIDYEYAATKGIKVSNVPAYGSSTVAEFAFALLLTLSRKIREGGQALKENGNYSTPQNTQGFDLENKTIGIVGTGKIGKNIVKIAKGFNMNVLAYDLYPDMTFAAENNFIYKTLPEVLSGSDIVTLHAPYTKENHHLINKENISLFKKGAYLINTARGELIETEALVGALQNGTIAGAGLDVLEGEKEFKKGDVIPMLQMPNVLMTPHIAFNTLEAETRIFQTTIDNIKGFINTAPINLVK